MAAKDIRTEERMSIRAYAQLIGVDEKTVRKARDAGMLQQGFDQLTGKIIPHLANQAWGNAQRGGRRKAGVGKENRIKKLFEELEKTSPNITPSDDELIAGEEIRTGGLLEAIKITSNMGIAEAVRRREIIALALDKKKLEEAEGILVKREVVENAFYLLGSELRKALLDIPARIARDVMAASNEIAGITIMTDEITTILTTYGNLKENTFKTE